MLALVSVSSTRDFVSKYDDPANPTVFVVSPLSVSQRAWIKDKTATFTDGTPGQPDTKLSFNIYQRALIAAQCCLKEIKNAQDPKTGKVVSFSTEIKEQTIARSMNGKSVSGFTDEVLSGIDEKVLLELGEFILETSTLKEKQEKN